MNYYVLIPTHIQTPTLNCTHTILLFYRNSHVGEWSSLYRHQNATKQFSLHIYPVLRYLKNRLGYIVKFKLRCFESMAPGHYLKCIITYETAFWRPLGHCGGIAATGRTDDPEKVFNIGVINYVQFQIQPVMLVYDDTSENGVPALVVFVNEEFAGS